MLKFMIYCCIVLVRHIELTKDLYRRTSRR